MMNEPAFPIVDATNVHHTGMTLRDYFAGKAMSGLISDTIMANDPDYASKLAYVLADAMMEARQK